MIRELWTCSKHDKIHPPTYNTKIICSETRTHLRCWLCITRYDDMRWAWLVRWHRIRRRHYLNSNHHCTIEKLGFSYCEALGWIPHTRIAITHINKQAGKQHSSPSIAPHFIMIRRHLNFKIFVDTWISLKGDCWQSAINTLLIFPRVVKFCCC